MATGNASSDGSAVDPEVFARRASSFGAVAAAYAEHRPDYPAAAVAWALEPALAAEAEAGTAAAGGAPAVLDVLDLGAGTGILTASLAALGHRVTAVEPDAGMRAELSARLPQVTVLDGNAERIPLPDASVDAVAVGQAFHWFDQDRALPELARVLRPGGVVAALWNTDDDRIGWVAELRRIGAKRVSYVDWPASRTVQPHPAFGELESAGFPHTQPRTVESMVATIGTHSGVQVLEPAERDDLLRRVRELLESRPETSGGSFDLEIITRVQRRVRTAG
jgi:SAM-dependent methyltransferase